MLQGAVFVAGVCFPPIVTAKAGLAYIRRRMRYVYTFSNPHNHDLYKQFFWCYLPANISNCQRLCDVRSSIPYNLSDDLLGHNILEFSFDKFPALVRKIITITVEVEMDVQSDVQSDSTPEGWLSAERFIESDDFIIRTLASKLHRHSNYDTARAIFDWVRQNITYAGYLAEDIGAARALQQLRGDCTEYAYLVVALARANNIPARMIGGYVLENDGVVSSKDYHNWAEIFLGGKWRLVDAQKETWLVSSSNYIACRIYRDAVINSIGLAHKYKVSGDLNILF